MLVRGIDTDNYDGNISVKRFKSLADNFAVRFNIVGCQRGDNGNFTAPQIKNSEEAGLIVPLTYDFLLYKGEDGSQGLRRMSKALAFGKRVAPDIEGVSHPKGKGAYVELLHRAKDLLVSAGQFWGWYSSPSEWSRLTGNTQEFAGDRGWTAGYPFSTQERAILPPQDFMPDFANYPAFGGLAPSVWQYANICYGEPSFDMNAMEENEMQWVVKDKQLVATTDSGLEVVMIGDEEGNFPGQIKKLFGDTWYWLCKDDQGNAYWSPTQGD